MRNKLFTSVQMKRPSQSTFDLTHDVKMSGKMGKLLPIMALDVLPGDSFNIGADALVKLAPMLAPIMHRVDFTIHYFFVPNRIIYPNWEEFISGTPTIGGAEHAVPYINFSNSSSPDIKQLADYFGIPTPGPGATAEQISALPFAAYNLIYNEYYRAQDIIPKIGFISCADGDNTIPALADCKVRNRAWEHDYFTSALLSTQRGVEVLMPIEGSGSVTYDDISSVYTSGGAAPADNTLIGNGQAPGSGSLLMVGKTGTGVNGGTGRIENIDEVLITNSTVSINDLRRANRLQEWLERNQLAGSRYNESIMAHFGRRTSDSRLQRAEYLGGGKTPIKISEVLTTAYSEDADTNNVPAGTMVGHGISYGDSNGITYNCEEHGFFISIMSIMPTSGYMQGLPRMFAQRKTFLDYPWPSFAHLGEQPVYDYEVYADETALTLDEETGDFPVFGYQSRYADWKHMLSHAHGSFRSSLDFWHLIRKFADAPVLGATFNTFQDEEQDRVFAVQDETDNCWCFIHNKTSVKRTLPYYGTPTL